MKRFLLLLPLLLFSTLLSAQDGLLELESGWMTDIFRGVLGMVVLVGVGFLLSANRKAVDWGLVLKGIALQLILGLAILKVPFIYDIFDAIADFFIRILEFTEAGASFVLGAWPDYLIVENAADENRPFAIGYIFAFKVLPTIVFFAAFSSLLYYLGILQKIVYALAWVMSKLMHMSGAESLAAAANVFIGQTEAPLVVRPYLEGMTRSEIMCLMTGGMATIAGGVFAAFIGFLGNEYAIHLLTASIISAPAAIVFAKILYPEDTPEKLNRNLDISKEKIGSNVLDAITNGTVDGLKLAINVGAMLLVFIAMIAMLNYILGDWIGAWTGLNDLVAEWTDGSYEKFSLEYLFGLFFAPFAWILGVPSADILSVGELLGTKTIINEFVAYANLPSAELTYKKSWIIATYAL
ncbi:MAG: NupC/NupG family nucleoside CNT transporter, partial [Flavobacteriales bacterium]|nr:NupC/NupG family nucleoside CNT transporter [Flavobacteriales bacterium]